MDSKADERERSDRQPVLETPRLILCHLCEDDAPFILELLNDESFIRYIGDKGVRNLEDAVGYLRTGPMDSYRRFGFGLFLTLLREDLSSIGICGLLKRDELDDPDVGFAFLPRYWSKGYASESATAVLEWGWSTFGMRRIVAITSTENHDSIRLLQKIGMTFEGLVQLGDDQRKVNLYGIETK